MKGARALAAVASMAFALVGVATTQTGPDWRPEGPPLASATDISRSPLQLDTLYLATQNGGVYRSDDGGKRWSLPGDELTSRRIRWVEADPSKADTVWAGEDDPGNPAVWRSLDRGATWKLVTDSYRGEMVTLHPVGWPIVFAPAKATDIWVPSTSLNYRSRDGGRTWTDFRVPNQDVYLIAVHPQNPDIVWAAGAGQNYHLSRTDDGGRTWKGIGKGLEQRVTVLVAAGGAQPVLYAATGFNNFFKSTDNGETFTPIPSPVSGTRRIMRLKFAPGTPPTMWLTTDAGLFKSTDGQQWTPADHGTGRYLVTGLAFDPREPNAIVAAVAGAGVYRTADGGSTWAVSNAGLGAGWIEELYAQPAAATVIAKTGAGTFLRERSGAWTELGAPFVTGDKEVDLPGFLFEGSSGAIWAHDSADLWRSADGGSKFAAVDYKRSRGVDSVGFRSLAQHPQNPKVLWAGNWTGRSEGTSVYKSIDGGREWRPSGKGLPTEAVTLLRTGAAEQVIALSGRRALYATSDGGASWAAIGRGLPDADVVQVTIDPSQPSRVFAVAGNSLFVSTDRGAAFAKVGGTVEKERIRALAAAPDGTVFAGSFRGIFATRDAGTTWTALTGSLPNTDVRAIAIGGSPESRLWVGLAGGSVWSAPLPKR